MSGLCLFAAFVLLGNGEAIPKEKGVWVEEKTPPLSERNIRHRFGEKTYLKVALEPSMDVPFARLRLGFAPWSAGADGVVWEVSEAFSAAKEGAACDIALLERMREVQRDALKEKDPDRRLAGRKLGAFLVNLKATDDPDLLHLEALARLRDAEKTLGLSPTPLAPFVRDSVAGRLPWQLARVQARSDALARKSTRKTQKAPTPEMEKWTKVEMLPNAPASFAQGLSVTWYNGHFIRFYVTGSEPLPQGTDGWPGGSVAIRLWVPDLVPESWLVYDVDCSLEAEMPRMVWRTTRLWGRNYPQPISSSACMGQGAQPWRFEWTFNPSDIFDQRPSLKAGFRDSWFAEVRHTDAKGAVREGRVRLLWTAGGRDAELAAGDILPFETYQTKVKPIYEKLRTRWEWGEDDRFYRDFVKVVLDADSKLLEKIYTCCGSLPPIKKEVPAVRLKFYREIPRIVFIEERIDDLRKAYLVDLLEGREPTLPKLKLPSPEKASAESPDVDDGEKLELDEEEF